MRLFASTSRPSCRTTIRLVNFEPPGRSGPRVGRAGPTGSMTVRCSSAIRKDLRHLRHASRPRPRRPATSSRVAPMLAWTAAMTAPSTSGASLIRTHPLRRRREILERDLEAQCRAPQVQQDQGRRRTQRGGPDGRLIGRRAGAESTVLGAPGDGQARRPDRPTWATMSRSPSTRVRLWDTRTRLTNRSSFRLVRAVIVPATQQEESNESHREPR